MRVTNKPADLRRFGNQLVVEEAAGHGAHRDGAGHRPEPGAVVAGRVHARHAGVAEGIGLQQPGFGEGAAQGFGQRGGLFKRHPSIERPQRVLRAVGQPQAVEYAPGVVYLRNLRLHYRNSEGLQLLALLRTDSSGAIGEQGELPGPVADELAKIQRRQ